MSKLEGMPKIYYINLDEANDRNEHIIGMFEQYGITNFERYEAKRPDLSGHELLGPYEYGCTMSHINVLKQIASSEEDYAVVVEDDLDLSTVEKWNFSWNDFVQNLPEFDIVQLSRHQFGYPELRGNTERTGFKFKKWDRGDVCTVAYLVTKEYANKILTAYEKDPVGLSGFSSYSDTTGPVADHALYDGFNSYSVCIFGFKVFESQVSPGTVFQPFLDNVEYMKELFNKEMLLNDIF